MFETSKVMNTALQFLYSNKVQGQTSLHAGSVFHFKFLISTHLKHGSILNRKALVALSCNRYIELCFSRTDIFSHHLGVAMLF